MLLENDVLQLEVSGFNTQSHTRWVMTHHVIIDDPPSGSTEYEQLQATAEAFYAMWQTYFLPYLSEDLQLSAAKAFRVAPNASVVGVYIESDTGAETGDSMEPDTAIVITLRTDFAGRSGLGRRFLAGIPEAYQDAGLVLEAPAGLYRLAADAVLFANVSPPGGTMVPVVFSPTLWAATSVVADSAHAIVSTEVDRVLRMQTRRDYKLRAPV